VDEARTLLIMREDGNLISLDMLAPYLPDDLAKSTCRIMQKVAKTDNAAKYSATESATDPEVRQMVAASLQNPAGGNYGSGGPACNVRGGAYRPPAACA
jgi:hypothetical protein